MREDFQESLEKMFPKGYMLVHILPNDDPQLSWFNPNNDPVFNELNEILEEEGLFDDPYEEHNNDLN